MLVLPPLPYATRTLASNEMNTLQGIVSGDEGEILLSGSISPDDNVSDLLNTRTIVRTNVFNPKIYMIITL